MSIMERWLGGRIRIWRVLGLNLHVVGQVIICVHVASYGLPCTAKRKKKNVEIISMKKCHSPSSYCLMTMMHGTGPSSHRLGGRFWIWKASDSRLCIGGTGYKMYVCVWVRPYMASLVHQKERKKMNKLSLWKNVIHPLLTIVCFTNLHVYFLPLYFSKFLKFLRCSKIVS